MGPRHTVPPQPSTAHSAGYFPLWVDVDGWACPPRLSTGCHHPPNTRVSGPNHPLSTVSTPPTTYTTTTSTPYCHRDMTLRVRCMGTRIRQAGTLIECAGPVLVMNSPAALPWHRVSHRAG